MIIESELVHDPAKSIIVVFTRGYGDGNWKLFSQEDMEMEIEFQTGNWKSF